MKICSTYKVRLTERNLAFSNTVELYRRAVDFFIGVMRSRPDSISECSTGSQAVNRVERLTIPTAKRPEVPYDFSAKFYKFPCYLRRNARNGLRRKHSHDSTGCVFLFFIIIANLIGHGLFIQIGCDVCNCLDGRSRRIHIADGCSDFLRVFYRRTAGQQEHGCHSTKTASKQTLTTPWSSAV